MGTGLKIYNWCELSHGVDVQDANFVKIGEMNAIQLREKVNASPAILLYFKNNHCGPCQVLRPKIEALIHKNFPKINLEIIDTEIFPEINSEFQVYSNPTLIVFFDGREYIRKSKFVSVSELEKEISRLYEMAF